MIKEEILKLLGEASDKLIHTDIVIYPAGLMGNSLKDKCNSYEYNDTISDKEPKFLDIQDYRKSLLELISKLIDFYKEV